jgi:hypothetical protein
MVTCRKLVASVVLASTGRQLRVSSASVFRGMAVINEHDIVHNGATDDGIIVTITTRNWTKAKLPDRVDSAAKS